MSTLRAWCMAAFAVLCLTSPSSAQELNVPILREANEAFYRTNAMTLNVRVDDDGGEYTYAKRLPRMKNIIKETNGGMDIIGMSELDPGPFDQMAAALPEYNWVKQDMGSDDEILAIFFRASRYDLLDYNSFTIPLSQRDGHCDTLWQDNDQKDRGLQWARLRDRRTGRAFYVYNTHFSSGNSCERIGMAEITAHRIADRTFPNDPVIYLGDFNDGVKADGTFNAAYQTLLDETGLTNSYAVKHRMTSGEAFTSSNDFDPTRRFGRMFDFVLVSNDVGIHSATIQYDIFTPSGLRIECKSIVNGRCPTGDRASDLLVYSDHWAVWSSLKLPPISIGVIVLE